MRCAEALATSPDPEVAAQEALDRLAADLDGDVADLALGFATWHHGDALGTLAREARRRGLARHVLGVTGEGIVGAGREVEGLPALALWAIRLPDGSSVRPVRFEGDEDDLQRIGPVDDPGHALLIALADPFSFPTDPWLKRLNAELRGLRVVGGMASAGHGPRQNRLVLDDEVVDSGGVAALLTGPIAARIVVSQGCRPVGRHCIVTRVDRNLIQELGRRPALAVFQETYNELGPEDQALVRQGLHIGRVINEYQGEFRRGDFLVRNVVGADESGAIAITDLVRVGQTVQFHVRDAGTADEDLRSLLAEHAGTPIAGALLFTCNGRGSRLFSVPDHDVSVTRELLGPVPVAGFFAMGELGPVGGQNFIHGFTASLLLFEGSPPAPPAG